MSSASIVLLEFSFAPRRFSSITTWKRDWDLLTLESNIAMEELRRGFSVKEFVVNWRTGWIAALIHPMLQRTLQLFQLI